jgi:hypothetical protein
MERGVGKVQHSWCSRGPSDLLAIFSFSPRLPIPSTSQAHLPCLVLTHCSPVGCSLAYYRLLSIELGSPRCSIHLQGEFRALASRPDSAAGAFASMHALALLDRVSLETMSKWLLC